MSNDIAEFLRRAAQRYAQQQPAAPARPVILEAEVVEDAEIVDAGDVSGEDVAEHVRQRMDTSRFSRRAARLGATVDQSDDRLEAHLQDVFEHKLGQLGGRASQTLPPTPAAPPATATPPAPQISSGGGSAIMELLRDKNQFRNAVILSEILRRPDI